PGPDPASLKAQTQRSRKAPCPAYAPSLPEGGSRTLAHAGARAGVASSSVLPEGPYQYGEPALCAIGLLQVQPAHMRIVKMTATTSPRQTWELWAGAVEMLWALAPAMLPWRAPRGRGHVLCILSGRSLQGRRLSCNTPRQRSHEVSAPLRIYANRAPLRGSRAVFHRAHEKPA